MSDVAIGLILAAGIGLWIELWPSPFDQRLRAKAKQERRRGR